MPRQQTMHLQEAPGRPAADARVIDAQFDEIGVKKRGLFARMWRGAITVFWVAAIGFLIPPALVVIHEVSDYFAGR